MSIRQDIDLALRDLHDEDPKVRKEAVDWFRELGEREGAIYIPHRSLKKIAQQASTSFLPPVADWDDPSFQLVYLIAQYPHEDLKDLLVKQYDNLSLDAKRVVITYLAFFEEEGERTALSLVSRSFEREERVLPVMELTETPSLATKILQQSRSYFEDPQLKDDLYRLLVCCLDMHFIQRFEGRILTPLIARDYEEAKERYLSYDAAYSPRFAYGTWKETYQPIRDMMNVFLTLMEYYEVPDVKRLLTEALTFQDPIVRSGAVIACLQRNLPVDSALIHQSATGMETSHIFWAELVRIQKPHLFPDLLNRQQYFAQSHAFHFIQGTTDDWLEDVELRGDEEVFLYDQTVRFYLAKGTIRGEVHPLWIGGFETEDEDEWVIRSALDWLEEEVYQDGMEAAYKERFLARLTIERSEQGEYILFENETGTSRWIYLFYGYLLYQFVQGGILEKDESFAVFCLLVLAVTFFYQLSRSRFWRGTLTVEAKMNGLEVNRTRRGARMGLPLSSVQEVQQERRLGQRYAAIVDIEGNKCIQCPLSKEEIEELQGVISDLRR